MQQHPTEMTKLTTVGVIADHPLYQPLQRYVIGIEDVEIYLASEEESIKMEASGTGAEYRPNKNIIVIPKGVTPWMLAHELKHAQDVAKIKKSGSVIGQLSLLNAGLANFARRKTRNFNAPILSIIKSLCYNWYRYGNTLERNSYKVQGKVKKQYAGKGIPNSGTIISRGGQGNGKIFPKPWDSFASTVEENKGNRKRNKGKIQSFGAIEEDSEISERPTNGNSNSILGFKQTSKQDEIKIEKATRDSLYKWYGEVEKARYDVDKDLNQFNKITKSTAKDFSKKTGLRVSDKMIREILPFLRERTEVPEALGRKDLTEFYNKLDKNDIARLTKLADDVCGKFDKYWQNYKDAKGIISDEDIENHISHLWNVGKKQKGILTNYFNTNSRFAKPRTIEFMFDCKNFAKGL